MNRHFEIRYEQTLDEASEIFSSDSDVINALDSFLRNHISEAELVSRLNYLKIHALSAAREKLENPEEEGLESA